MSTHLILGAGPVGVHVARQLGSAWHVPCVEPLPIAAIFGGAPTDIDLALEATIQWFASASNAATTS